jgi:hypothetical protein
LKFNYELVSLTQWNDWTRQCNNRKLEHHIFKKTTPKSFLFLAVLGFLWLTCCIYCKKCFTISFIIQNTESTFKRKALTFKVRALHGFVCGDTWMS